MGDQVDLARSLARDGGPADDLFDQVVQAAGRALDVETVGGDLLMAPGPYPLEQVLVRRRGKGGRGQGPGRPTNSTEADKDAVIVFIGNEQI